MKAIVKLLITLAALIICSADARASFPRVRNFSRNTHGGGTQTWAIASDALGQMYFGNKNGLLTFDSYSWDLSSVNNGSTVRALMLDKENDRLYAGASDEFGYFTHDTITGQSQYVNLSDQLSAESRSFKEIWNIFKIDGSRAVWFQSDNCIFCYNDHGINTLNAHDRITASAAINGRIYVATAHGGLSELRGGSLYPAGDCTALDNARVCAILPYNNTIMAVTEYNGLYILVDSNFIRLNTDIDSFLTSSQVFCATVSPQGDYAFGTVSKGVAIKNFTDNKTSYANIETGMQNNTVLSAYFSDDGNLWLGLDNGIDMVNYTSPFYSLLGSVTTYGAGYMSLHKDGLLYLGTNQGLFAMDFPSESTPEPPELKPILRGQVWDISAIDNDVFVCSDAGVSYGNGVKFTNINSHGSEIPGSWAAAELKHHPGYALVSSYEAFFLLRRNGERWENLGSVDGYNDIGGHFIEDNYGNIWISHWLKGIYCLTLDTTKRRFSSIRFYDNSNGLPTNHNIGVIPIDGQPHFLTEGGFYNLSSDRTRLTPDSALNSIFGAVIAPRIHIAPNGDMWCISGTSVSVASNNSDGTMSIDSVTYSPMIDGLIRGFDHFNFIGDHRLIVSMQDGFYDINLNRRRDEPESCDVFFKSLQMQGDTTITLCPHHLNRQITIPYDLNSLLIEAVAPEYRDDRVVMYSFYLENYDSDWSTWSTSAAKEYTHLLEGEYVMRVKALNPLTRTVNERVMQFSILPPWYRSTTAKVIYLILTLILLYFSYKAVKSVSLRASRRVASRKEQELETMRRHAKEESLLKDYEIAELKGRQLELDIRHKTEELSNITMNVVRKNEILLDISNRLDKIAANDIAPDVQRQINRIKSLIRENISHDDDWRNFMHNFDAAYEDFTHNLQALHPGLTPTELRVCCYLKMGLSSKEIAPLFNISYRSVEMTRYRLRKKLNLARETSLTEYLQNITSH
ncbi:MAG: LuxR C-terminal-related transcriptional regulator [Odoribacter sp.]|nr:LuxR C-terminal-related transcriptional regulator [Odoribacter sp.]